jgi:hypothetical protein
MSAPFTLADAAMITAANREAAVLQKRRDLSGLTAERKLPMKLHAGVSALSRPVLSSALFGFRKDLVRLTYTSQHPLVLKAFECRQYGTCELTYIGEELRQDDRRVLAFLIERVRGREVDFVTKLHARDFCEEIGWSRESRSVDKLDSSLQRLYVGSLKAKYSRGDFTSRFLLDARADGEVRCVQLHPDLALSFFSAGHSYLPCREYRELTDGFATWLQGFLRAHTDEGRFELAAVRAASGSTASVDTFGRMVRDTMQKLKDIGVVVHFSFGRDMLRVAFDEPAAKALRAADAEAAARKAEAAARKAAKAAAAATTATAD